MNAIQPPRVWRLAVAALLVASVLGLSHATARPAAATDCVTYYCATLTVTVTGDGYTRVVDNQGEIDCYYNAGSYYGTCHVQYYWIGPDPLAVTITSYAQANSWVCTYYGTYICSDIGGTRSFSLSLSNKESAYRESEAHLAHSLNTSISPSGDGDGRVTSNPAGIDCKVVAGVGSGTCQTTWYFKSTLTLTMTGTAATDDYACLATSCHAVGVPIQSGPYTYTGSATNSWSFSFWHGHPILTVAVVGPGSVSSSPAGISCPSACSKYFSAGTLVSLSATVPAGYGLSWSGACSGTATICNVQLGTADASATATFAKLFTPPPSSAPTPRPTPTATIRPSSAPTATPGVTPPPGATPPAGATGPAGVPTMTPGASIGEQPATPVASAAASQAVAPGSTPGSGSTSPGGESAPDDIVGLPDQAAIDAGGGAIVPIVALLIVVAIIALGVGLALGRRGRSPTPPRA